MSDVLATWITIGGAIAAGAFTVYEYLGTQQSGRIRTTLEYVQRYDAKPLLETRLRLDRFWESRAEEVFRASSQKDGSNQLKAYVLGRIRSDSVVEADTAAMIRFFDGLHACVCADLCDAPTAVRMFGKDASALYGLNFPYIDSQRSRLKDKEYGLSLYAMTRAYNHHEEEKKFACERS